MRCQENIGFLILHRCEKVADYQCVQCKRKVCRDHATPVEDPLPPQEAGAAPSATPAADGTFICATCARKRQQVSQQTGRNTTMDDDRYYRYPYYGSYYPYYADNYYDDRDRGVFQRGATDAGAGLES